MYLKFDVIFDSLLENETGGDDSPIGETIFEQYNLMNPKEKLIWEVVSDKNTNSVIRTCLSILNQRMSYFNDLYFNYEIDGTTSEELEKYIKPILRVIKRYSLSMVSDVLNWAKKRDYITNANIDELNNFLSSTTLTSVQPYAKDSNGKPIWTSATKTHRNADILLVNDDQWNEFNGFKMVYHELSTIVYNIFGRRI